MGERAMTTYDKPKRGESVGELAGISTRFIALFIDSFILGVITGVLTRGGLATGGLASFVVGMIYQW